MHCLKLFYSKKKYSNLVKIFVSRLFEIATNQSAPGLNRGLSSKFRWLTSVNHMKFTEECVMYTEKKHFLIKKSLQINMGLPLGTRVKKQSMETKHIFLAKKKFDAQQSVNKVTLTVFWNIKKHQN